MGDYSTLGGGQKWVGGTTVNSRGQSVTPSATANTKGSYAQLLSGAGNTADAACVVLDLTNGSANTDYLVDLAIGAAGSEQIIATNLFMSGGGGLAGNLVYSYILPIAIPTGTRIAARCQAGTASAASLHATLHVMAQGFLPSAPLQRLTAYGPNTADSGGVSVDPGGTANTKPSTWTEITSSTTNPMRMLYAAFGLAQNSAPSTATWLVDLGIGASGSEIGIGGSSATTGLVSLPFRVGVLTDFLWSPLVVGPLAVSIPAGTRLAARAQCSITDATDRLFDVMLYGID
jgi:hypothetical protein